MPDKSPHSESGLDRLGDLNVNDGVEDAGDDSNIHLFRKTAYSDLIVSSTALKLLQDDWGVVLSSAPAALGRLAQCFVLASEPLASSLVFPKNAELPRESLRANLVHCSDLGRKAFREAESKMNKLSMVIQALCEPDGTIDKIAQDVEDPDLAELDLPDQLTALRRVSDACVTDTIDIKKTVDAWKDFATRLYGACVDEDETLKRTQADLNAQVRDKRMAVGLKSTAVTEIQKQAEYYSSQITDRKGEFAKAQKALPKRGWPHFGRRSKKPSKFELSNVGINVESGGLLSSFIKAGGNANWTKRKEAEPKSSDKPGGWGEIDPGYALAYQLCPTVHRLAELLTLGPDHFNGVDWEQLAGRRGSAESSIRDILRRIHGELASVQEEHSPIVRRVRSAIMPVQVVLEALTVLVRKETSVNATIEVDVAESAKTWREEVRTAEEKLSEILGEQLELARQQVQEEERQGILLRKTALSRIELRYERLRSAQKALLEAEEKANQRREKERKEIEELEIMQQEFHKLLDSEATLGQVKQIVRECVKKLQDFCAHLDQLTTFFANMRDHIQFIDEMRVNSFILNVGKANTLGDRIHNPQTNETTRLKLEKRLADIKVEALQLKGYYLVAGVMTITYVEVSKRYIMPEIVRIDRLSLPDAAPMSKEARMHKMEEIGQLAKEARMNISHLANARRDQYAAIMYQKRGEIEEVEE
ncbi:MAG: hypothetical protein M1816_004015 [Peltula sp. TS41687]|nr:MAG: hypothetical protein M1816_004015 [Peltula sp. TS41687]